MQPLWRRVRPRAVVTSCAKHHYHRLLLSPVDWPTARPPRSHLARPNTVDWRRRGEQLSRRKNFRSNSGPRRGETANHEAGMKATEAVCWLICLAGAQCAAFTFHSQQYAAGANADLSTGFFGKMLVTPINYAVHGKIVARCRSEARIAYL